MSLTINFLKKSQYQLESFYLKKQLKINGFTSIRSNIIARSINQSCLCALINKCGFNPFVKFFYETI